MQNRDYNRNNKLFKIMTLAAMALMIISSYRASAAEYHSHPKHQQRKSIVRKQDCINKQTNKNIKSIQMVHASICPNHLS